MNKKSLLIPLLIIIILAVSITGCTLSTMTVKLNPQVPMDALQGKRIPYKVALYMDTEFLEYRFKEKNSAELSNMDYELGNAAKSLLLETFMRISDGVVIVDSKPPYASGEKVSFSIVIEPHFAAFSEKHSATLRIADYYACVEFHVIIYEASGRVVLDQNFKGEGTVKGKATISPASNYAAPAEVALANVIVEMVDAIKGLNIATDGPMK